MIRDSVLIFLEECLVFDLIVFGLGKLEAGDTEVVLKTCDLGLVSVDLPHIKVNVMAGWGVLVELTVGLEGTSRCLGLLGIGTRPVSVVGATIGTIILVGGLPFRHLTLILFDLN